MMAAKVSAAVDEDLEQWNFVPFSRRRSIFYEERPAYGVPIHIVAAEELARLGRNHCLWKVTKKSPVKTDQS
jgi:hypothetical protein